MHRSSDRRLAWIAVACAAVLAACGNPSGSGGSHARGAQRDLRELQRIIYQPLACDADDDCPTGSHCDDGSATCAWACLADDECGAGHQCTLRGVCEQAAPGTVAPPAPPLLIERAFDDATCVDENNVPLTQAEKYAILSTLNADDVACDESKLGSDCPCGAYCGGDGYCRVDCMSGSSPPAGTTCTAPNTTCNPVGQCVSMPPPPPPKLQLSIQLGTGLATANTATGAKLVEVPVTVTANSLDVIDPTNPVSPATVSFTFPEQTAFDRGLTTEPTGPMPRVKCAPSAPLGKACDLTGGWTFNIATDKLVSAVRTIWVEIPQVTTQHTWTLRAASQWAASPTQKTVEADPVVIPPGAIGRFKGTMTMQWSNGVTQVAGPPTPVDAILTGTRLAVFDPSRLMFPDGHVVMSRDPGVGTLLAWLDSPFTTGNAHRYDVKLQPGGFQYSNTTGHLFQQLYLQVGAIMSYGLVLELDYDGGLEAAAPQCTAAADCAAGSYCDPEMDRCLPGTGPAPGGGIIEDGQAIASTELRSGEVDAWAGPARSLANPSPLLQGSGVAGVERGYCYRAANQAGASFFPTTTALEPNSLDRLCHEGGTSSFEYQQRTFEYVNTNVELNPGTSFDLFEQCGKDLAEQPPEAPTLFSMYKANKCVSLGRFFTAMTANVAAGVGQPLRDAGQRVVHQLVRQWLGVNAYYASTAVRDRNYDDVLADSVAPANERLGDAVDLVDQGLRVMLDPRIRPQYADGIDLDKVLASPDYRNGQRPVVRWSFNGDAPATATDGTNAFAGSPQYFGGSLVCKNTTGDVTSTQPVEFPPNADLDTRFTIGMYLLARTYPLSSSFSYTLFDKVDSGGHHLRVTAAMYGAGSATPYLVLKLENPSETVTFDPILESVRDPVWGFLAIVADRGSYTLYRYNMAGQIQQLAGHPQTNNPIDWGGPGPITLQCSLPQAAQCTSWDMFLPGDNLGIGFEPSSEKPSFWYSCNGGICNGTNPDQASCNAKAVARRNALVAEATAAGAPAWAANQVTVTAGPYTETSHTIGWEGNKKQEQWTFDCPLAIAQRAVKTNASKPACGAPPGTPTSKPYTQDGLVYDEVAVWSRAVQLDEFARMAQSWGWNGFNLALPPLQTLPGGKEQQTGLPAHILEAAAADLELLNQYIESERGVMYTECVEAGEHTARDRTVARAGRNLRLVSALESQVSWMFETEADVTAWLPRLAAARKRLSGLRQRTLELIQLASTCSNPLDIPEDLLPLYVGEAVGPTDKFFASSRYLAGLAETEIGKAEQFETKAKDAYTRERAERLAFDDQRDTKAVRETNLRATYESQLRRLCGTPAGSIKLLAGFLDGTITADNCFFKTAAEDAECAGATVRPVEEVPAKCLRGQLGEHVVSIQTALVDLKNANNTLDRAEQQFDADGAYCAKRQEFLHASEKILADHVAFMRSLRSRDQMMDKLIASPIEAGFSRNWTQMRIGLEDLKENLGNFDLNKALHGEFNQGFPLAEREQRAQEDYDALVLARSHELDCKECYHQVENEKFTIDAARDAIYRVDAQIKAAVFGLSNELNGLAGLISEADGQLAAELRIDGTPPVFHFWLDQDIADYQRHFAYARRLTFLAVRALEYEAQQSVGLRAGVFTARRPEDLSTVITGVRAWSSPETGGIGRTLDPIKVVLSLRDEILKIKDLAQFTTPLPDQPKLTPEQAFKQFLASDAAKLYDASGAYLGRGIRFAISPQSWAASDVACAERIWRVDNSLLIDGPPNQHSVVIYQENSFGEQTCHDRSGDVITAHANPSVNVLTGDTSAFATKGSTTPMTIDGQPNLNHEALRLVPESSNSGFAGRGLYANYVLLFPKGTWPDATPWSNAPLSKVSDVLLRFDIVDANNAGSL